MKLLNTYSPRILVTPRVLTISLKLTHLLYLPIQAIGAV